MEINKLVVEIVAVSTGGLPGESPRRRINLEKGFKPLSGPVGTSVSMIFKKHQNGPQHRTKKTSRNGPAC